MKILITAGATTEPIDKVRFITNFSTGRTGTELADFFKKKKCDVYYFHGVGAIKPNVKGSKLVEYTSFDDLDKKLKTFLKKIRIDMIIHLAAVSDYSVKYVKVGSKKYNPAKLSKIDSSAKEIELKLKRNSKIIGKIPKYSNSLLVGFKLTNTKSDTQIKQAVKKVSADYVVHNDFLEAKKSTTRPFTIYKEGKKVVKCKNTQDLSKVLFNIGKKK